MNARARLPGLVVAALLACAAASAMLAYTGFGRAVFVGRSDSFLSILRTAAWFTGVTWAVIVGTLVCVGIRARGAMVVAAAVLLLVPWVVLAGRAVSVGDDCRVVAGWFAFRSRVIPLSNFASEWGTCEGPAAYRVEEVEEVFGTPWWITLSSGERRERLFVGPICGTLAVDQIRWATGVTTGRSTVLRRPSLLSLCIPQ
ncbi:MAG TPA: hypothetical protein VEO54_09095 [Thermoanaerobaculia bacterium]|nr:hypothetical protein [Thermoanaerobaculia bacterium]